MNTSYKRGFTLIELLVVIAIIGVLAGVVLTSLGTARSKARDTQKIANLKNIQLALELYADSNASGAYPAAVTTASGAVCYGLNTLVTTYMPVVPGDNAALTCDYKYSYDSAAKKYHIGVALETAHSILGTDNGRDSTGANFVGAKFLGESATCTAATGTDGCYDIAN